MDHFVEELGLSNNMIHTKRQVSDTWEVRKTEGQNEGKETAPPMSAGDWVANT